MSYSLKNLLDHVPGMIYISDNATKTIQWCNRDFEEETGYTLAEMNSMGLGFFEEIMHPQDFPKALEASENFKSDAKEFTGVCRVRGKKDSQWRWLHGTAVPFNYDNKGKIKEIICIFQELKGIDTHYQILQAFSFIIKNSLKNLIDDLTYCENRILDLLLQGKNNREITEELFISINTLKTHKAHIRDKLGLNNLHLLLDIAQVCK